MEQKLRHGPRWILVDKWQQRCNFVSTEGKTKRERIRNEESKI
jgi:hypothetical protein